MIIVMHLMNLYHKIIKEIAVLKMSKKFKKTLSKLRERERERERFYERVTALKVSGQAGNHKH